MSNYKVTKTKIEWATHVWNPVTGCSGGCQYCYARALAKRFAPGREREKCYRVKNNLPELPNEVFLPATMYHRMDPVLPKKSARIFINSVSDIAFWSQDAKDMVNDFIGCKKKHAFLALTKYDPLFKNWAAKDNLWRGISITGNPKEKNSELIRQSQFDKIEGRNKFVSYEPFLGPIESIPDVDWIIIGALTGPGSKKFQPEKEWVTSLVSKVESKGVAVYMKESLSPIFGGELIKEFPFGMT